MRFFLYKSILFNYSDLNVTAPFLFIVYNFEFIVSEYWVAYNCMIANCASAAQTNARFCFRLIKKKNFPFCFGINLPFGFVVYIKNKNKTFSQTVRQMHLVIVFKQILYLAPSVQKLYIYLIFNF